MSAMQIFRSTPGLGWSSKLLGFAVVLLMAAGMPARAASAPNRSVTAEPVARLSGHVLPNLADAVEVTSSASAARNVAGAGHADDLTLTVVLQRDDEVGFQQFLADVYDPQSPQFRKFLTPMQLVERFGPSQRSYDITLAWLRGQNFELADGSANRMTITVHGARADAQRAFGVNIRDYVMAGQHFYANDDEPALPAQIAPHVQAIVGLSNLAQPKSQVQAIVGSFVCAVTIGLVYEAIVPYTLGLHAGDKPPLNAAQLKALYDQLYADYKKALYKCVKNAVFFANHVPTGNDPPPPAWQGVDGTGQTVGLVQFDTFLTSDVADYISFIGLPASTINNLSQVHVNGGAGTTPGANQDEVLLDIADVLRIAPAAHIAVYDAPFNGSSTSFQAVFNAMINGGVNIISNSWSYCENQTTQADVQSIDSILQTAAAAGISVFNASGDHGSTCLDGATNTVGVPADSPNATAVGGTSLVTGPGYTYASETWWDGTSHTPVTGQGGYGISKFFARPSYQAALNTGSMRSIPDVAFNADPANGVLICAAALGGCPTGSTYGGTSSSAPQWAAFTALLNQSQGSQLGLLNAQIYPLANTNAFHSAASMNSDFYHVGLGSPDLARLHQKLTNQTTGTPSASISEVRAFGDGDVTLAADATSPLFVFADGSSKASIVVKLADSMGNIASGQTVVLAASAGSHATITPASGVTNAQDGAVTFTVTDLTPETLTFTATDSSDSVVVAQTAKVAFITPTAASGGINAAPTSVVADGSSVSTITVTLTDALSRPAPGKQVTLTQSGSAVIVGDPSRLTDSNGQLHFSASDNVQETVVFTAVDLTDGNLTVPGSASVTFNGGSGGCGGSAPVAGPGYAVSAYATGFVSQNGLYYGNVNIGGCLGASGLAFDASGNLYVSDYITGDVFKIPAGGGIAGAGNKITTTNLGPSLGALSFDNAGNLYGIKLSTSGSTAADGAVLKINTSTGTAITVAPNITCPFNLTTDPLSGDLFVDNGCFGAGTDSPAITRVANPATTPVVSTYVQTPAVPNGMLSFAPDGSLYLVTGYTGSPLIEVVSGTDKAQPATQTAVNGVGSYYAVLAYGSNPAGGAQSLVVGAPNVGGYANAVAAYDMTTSSPTISGILVKTAIGASVIGPDQCIYGASGNAVYKITNADGTCPLAFAAASLSLNPQVVSPSPVQGTTQTLTATFHHIAAADGTDVLFQISGANTLQKLVHSDANGNAILTYSGAHTGTDTIVASATVGGTTLTSIPAQIQWVAGAHTTALSLNPSSVGGTVAQTITVSASLTDLSSTPVAALAGQTVTFSLGSATCSGTTSAAGLASCSLVLGAAGTATLTASFAGSSSYLASSDSTDFITQVSAGFVGYVPLVPARLLDTRSGFTTIDGQDQGGGALSAQASLDLALLGRGGVAASGVDAVVLNVTVASATASGFLTVWPSGNTRPLASNLNFVAGQTVPNLVVVKLGSNSDVSIFNSAGSTNVVVDVVGYFTVGSDLTSLVPERIMDTRTGGKTVDAQFAGIGALQGQSQLDLTVAGRPNVPGVGVSTVVLNVTATNTTAAGFITVWPTGSARPLASNLNYFAAGQTVPNLVIAQVGTGGKVSLFNSAGSTDLIADIVGWLPTTTELTSLVPARLLDTRSGATTTDGLFAGSGPLAAQTFVDLTVVGRGGVPASGVGAVILNVTATAPTASGFLTVWPSGSSRPLASNLNFKAAQTVPNLVIAKVGSNGKVSLFNSAGSTQVIADVVGWLPPSP